MYDAGMRISLLGGALLIALQTLGCTDSIEDNCKSLCEWSDNCQGGATPSCTEDCIDGGATPSCSENCIENMKDADDDCRDALDYFADCVDSN